MQIRDVVIGETYVYNEDGSSNTSCSLKANSPATVLAIESALVYKKDGCGREIGVRSRCVKVKIYVGVDASHMAALDYDILEKDPDVTVVEKHVLAKTLIWPWEKEVERVRVRLEAEHRESMEFHYRQYLKSMLSVVLDKKGCFLIGSHRRYYDGPLPIDIDFPAYDSDLNVYTRASGYNAFVNGEEDGTNGASPYQIPHYDESFKAEVKRKKSILCAILPKVKIKDFDLVTNWKQEVEDTIAYIVDRHNVTATRTTIFEMWRKAVAEEATVLFWEDFVKQTYPLYEAYLEAQKALSLSSMLYDAGIISKKNIDF
jgi:hypothetical protein